jgi:hypothetical protein
VRPADYSRTGVRIARPRHQATGHFPEKGSPIGRSAAPASGDERLPCSPAVPLLLLLLLVRLLVLEIPRFRPPVSPPSATMAGEGGHRSLDPGAALLRPPHGLPRLTLRSPARMGRGTRTGTGHDQSPKLPQPAPGTRVAGGGFALADPHFNGGSGRGTRTGTGHEQGANRTMYRTSRHKSILVIRYPRSARWAWSRGRPRHSSGAAR